MPLVWGPTHVMAGTCEGRAGPVCREEHCTKLGMEVWHFR
jgi:hypothetical protein